MFQTSQLWFNHDFVALDCNFEDFATSEPCDNTFISHKDYSPDSLFNWTGDIILCVDDDGNICLCDDASCW